MGPWLSGAPPSPQSPSTQFLQPLGVGTMLSRVLEHPPTFPDENGARALDDVGRGLGCGSLVLRHSL